MGLANPTRENTVVPPSRYAQIERERRFFLAGLPVPRIAAHTQIWDRYLTGTPLRLRKMRVPERDEYVLKLTQKRALAAGDYARCQITNIYLSADEYHQLAPLFAEAPEIRKNRYAFDWEGRSYSVDYFLGPLQGLILAETSFASEEEMSTFVPPAFATSEVTSDEWFTGGQLCHRTFAELRSHRGFQAIP